MKVTSGVRSKSETVFPGGGQNVNLWSNPTKNKKISIKARLSPGQFLRPATNQWFGLSMKTANRSKSPTVCNIIFVSSFAGRGSGSPDDTHGLVPNLGRNLVNQSTWLLCYCSGLSRPVKCQHSHVHSQEVVIETNEWSFSHIKETEAHLALC